MVSPTTLPDQVHRAVTALLVAAVLALTGLVMPADASAEPTTANVPLNAQAQVPLYVENPSGPQLQSIDPVIRVYKDTNAWFGENRDNASLLALGKTLGSDYFVHPIAACQGGIPAGTDVVVFTSNGVGLASSTTAQNHPNCQASLQAFVQGGGVLIVDMGDNDLTGGYRAPGAVGTPSYVFPTPPDNATLAPAAVGPDGVPGTADDHPIVTGPDGVPGTADDLDNTKIDACCHVAHGNLVDGITLPSDATILMTATFDGVQKPILAEYCLRGGTVILDTLTKEFVAQQPRGTGPSYFLNALFAYALSSAAGGACGGGVGPPAELVLEPETATNPVGTTHCVTATVTDANGRPAGGVTVRFAVTGVNSASGSAVTDAEGQAQFCYSSTRAGADAISAYADTDADGMQDEGEPADTATKIWLPGDPAKLTLDPAAAENKVGTKHCVTATVTDLFGNPTPNVTVRFAVTGANSAGGSVTTNAGGQAQFCYTGTKAGLDTIKAYADADKDNSQDLGEPGSVATKLYHPGDPATLTLDPKTATNPVDSKHCVTATVTDAFGNPTPKITVRFSVTGSVTTSGSATTDANGQATFCYTGPALPGADVIKAYADTDKDSVQDPSEPFDVAEKIWVLPVSTPGCEVTITNGGWIVTKNGDRASFGGNAKVDADGDVSGQEEYQDHGPVEPMNVHGNVLVVVCRSATEATVFGEATIDGTGSHVYRIDVKDVAEPGKGKDTYRMRVDAYDSGEQVLQGGNVQIHK